MKMLMWHCKDFKVELTSVSNRPKNIEPEPQRGETEAMTDCIVSMLTLETEDKRESLEQAKEEIRKFAKDTGSDNIVLMPFAHLSNQLAGSEKTKKSVKTLENKLGEFNVLKSHFGYHKELLLRTFGHRTNVRFRDL